MDWKGRRTSTNVEDKRGRSVKGIVGGGISISGLISIEVNMRDTRPSFCSIRAASRCSTSISVLPDLKAFDSACCKPAWDFCVMRFRSIAFTPNSRLIIGLVTIHPCLCCSISSYISSIRSSNSMMMAAPDRFTPRDCRICRSL